MSALFNVDLSFGILMSIVISYRPFLFTFQCLKYRFLFTLFSTFVRRTQEEKLLKNVRSRARVFSCGPILKTTGRVMRQPRWHYHSLKGKRRPTPQVSANYVQVLAFLNYLRGLVISYNGNCQDQYNYCKVCDATGDILQHTNCSYTEIP